MLHNNKEERSENETTAAGQQRGQQNNITTKKQKQKVVLKCKKMRTIATTFRQFYIYVFVLKQCHVVVAWLL